MKTVEERFWSKVDRREPQECWTWQGAHGQKAGRQQYGTFNMGDRYVGAHRAAYILHHGAEPGPGMMVCHRCDNPRCVNPGHLFLGTAAENQRDKALKGRAKKAGRPHGGGKLGLDGARQVHIMRAAGKSIYEIAEYFKVTPTPIAWALKGLSYRSVWEEFHLAEAA